jgi:cold shock CspA family protein
MISYRKHWVYDKRHGFGYISMENTNKKAIFLRNTLPQDMMDVDEEDIIGSVVEFDLIVLRASRLTFLRAHGGGGHPEPHQAEEFNDDGLKVGTIVRYDFDSAYGFVRCVDYKEDIFFLKAEMPRELQDAEDHEEVEQQLVEFEVKRMDDGRMQALRMVLASGGDGRTALEIDDELHDMMMGFVSVNEEACECYSLLSLGSANLSLDTPT